MICGHCKTRDVSIQHVQGCANVEVRVRSIGRFEVEGPALQQAPKEPEPFAAFTLAHRVSNGEDVEGVYFKNGTYLKVVKGTNTGNYYAKSWSPEAETWAYEGRRPLYDLTEADRVTAEQAARFGAITGQCVFCGRRLTDERSIAVGYGPTCASHNGLPWGEKELVPAESPYAEAPEWTI